jgi:predicted transcriptional regulator
MKGGRAVQSDTLTFRLDRNLKAALGEIAEAEQKPIGELLREIIRERVRRKERSEFEAEARRQSLLVAEAARDPNSDEAAVMRELDVYLEWMADEWK